jgi:N-acylneuraminate cytidylyltransferase
MLAVVPARGGSKGLPGKNVRPLAGLPLIGHSLACAALCPEIARTIVSTDSEQIAEVARGLGGEVPFLRPPELARDETAMWPVLKHALAAADPGGSEYDYLLLLDPTSPARLPEDVAGAYRRLADEAEADGIVGVSEPGWNPIWHGVIDGGDGFMQQLIPDGTRYVRRQDVPAVYRINAAIYIWRAAFVREHDGSWLEGRHLLWEVPERRAQHVDDAEDFELLELLVREGLVRLPWLE